MLFFATVVCVFCDEGLEGKHGLSREEIRDNMLMYFSLNIQFDLQKGYR